jgi:hypothetical protein
LKRKFDLKKKEKLRDWAPVKISSLISESLVEGGTQQVGSQAVHSEPAAVGSSVVQIIVVNSFNFENSSISILQETKFKKSNKNNSPKQL